MRRPSLTTYSAAIKNHVSIDLWGRAGGQIRDRYLTLHAGPTSSSLSTIRCARQLHMAIANCSTDCYHPGISRVNIHRNHPSELHPVCTSGLT